MVNFLNAKNCPISNIGHIQLVNMLDSSDFDQVNSIFRGLDDCAKLYVFMRVFAAYRALQDEVHGGYYDSPHIDH